MPSSANEGDKVPFIAFGDDQRSTKVLPAHALSALEHLKSTISKAWTPAGPAGQPRIRKALACLDRLEAFCLQVKRLADHARSLARRPIPKVYEREARKRTGVSELRPGMTFMHVFDEACTDFESLLFHARAALDVVTRFVASEHGQQNESFSDLRRVLTNNSPRDDVRASALLQSLNEVSQIEGVLSDPPGGKSLRSRWRTIRAFNSGFEVLLQ